jgi:hypothetical protein
MILIIFCQASNVARNSMSRTNAEWYFIGQVQLKPVNQTGVGIRLNPSDGTFLLSRRASIFEVFVQSPLDPEFDFNHNELIETRLTVDNQLLGICTRTGQAIAVPLDSDNAVDDGVNLFYHKCKFDHIGSSFRLGNNQDVRWLRHCNSKLYVCEAPNKI